MNLQKLINLAQKQEDWNSYGWLMRYLQAFDSMRACEKEYEDIKVHFERVEEKLLQNSKNEGKK